MFEFNWFSAVLHFALESSIEVVIIFSVIKVVMWRKDYKNPTAASRFLLLPLVIPVFLSPTFHLIFPSLGSIAIIVQIEKAFPFLENALSSESYIAPFLIAAFLLLLTYNLLVGFAISLRESRKNSISKHCKRLDGQRALNRIARKFSVARPSLLVSSHDPKAAYIFGWKHPIIVLGDQCLRLLNAEELEALLAHELAHFKRGDTLLMLVAKTCRDLMFFNPLAHLIFREYNEAREQAADDLALKVTRKPLALASTLLKFLRMQQPTVAPVGSAGFQSHPRSLETRIRRLCDYPSSVESGSSGNGLYYGLSITLTIVLSIV